MKQNLAPQSLLISILLFIFIHNANGQMDKRQILYPVEIAEVEGKEVEYSISAIGTVEAFEKVAITARVQGVVEKIYFMEGTKIKKGEVVAEIEPDRYKVAVDAAKANLAKAEAVYNEALAALNRREQAEKNLPGLFPSDELEGWRAKVKTSQADVEIAKSSLALANLNYNDAYVKAPVSGVIETRFVQTGQFVQPGTVLGTIIRRDPLLLKFKVPVSDADELKLNMQVRFKIRNSEDVFKANISHIGSFANEDTRMVEVVCLVEESENQSLRPGTFAEIIIPIKRIENAPVIPQTAIRPTEKGFIAFVVKDDTVYERLLTLGLRTADGLVEVKSGLSTGELIVIRGAEALKDGSKVKIVNPSSTEKKPLSKTQ